MILKKGFTYISPKKWGPTFWKTIYFVALSYDSEDTTSQHFLETFFYSIGGTLPCGECQEHYQEYFNKNSIKNIYNDKLKVLKWIYELQKEINTRNKKETPSFNKWYDHIIEITKDKN